MQPCNRLQPSYNRATTRLQPGCNRLQPLQPGCNRVNTESQLCNRVTTGSQPSHNRVNTWGKGMIVPDPPARLNRRITDFLINTLFGLATRPVPGNKVGGSNIIDYTASNVIAAVDIIYATSASEILMLSIVILYFVQSSGIRLAIIGVFTLCSSGGYALLTTATPTEIFSFTAA